MKQKLAEAEVKTFWPTKIEEQPLLYLILAAQKSNFDHDFYKFKHKDAKPAVRVYKLIEKSVT